MCRILEHGTGLTGGLGWAHRRAVLRMDNQCTVRPPPRWPLVDGPSGTTISNITSMPDLGIKEKVGNRCTLRPLSEVLSETLQNNNFIGRKKAQYSLKYLYVYKCC